MLHNPILCDLAKWKARRKSRGWRADGGQVESGKLYAPVGKTFNARLDATVGDVIRVEATELLVDRSGGKQSITWFTPVVTDVIDQAPMTAEQVVALAQPEEFKKLLARAIPVLKTGEERYVLGIVLEPETVDAQKDIYSAAEIREAAHRFMEEYRNVGLMHRELVQPGRPR